MKAKTDFNLAEKMAELEKIEQYFQNVPDDPMEAIAKHQAAISIATEIKQYLKEAETVLIKVNEKNT